MLLATLSCGNILRVGTMGKVAKACGYGLILESDADRIGVDVE